MNAAGGINIFSQVSSPRADLRPSPQRPLAPKPVGETTKVEAYSASRNPQPKSVDGSSERFSEKLEGAMKQERPSSQPKGVEDDKKERGSDIAEKIEKKFTKTAKKEATPQFVAPNYFSDSVESKMVAHNLETQAQFKPEQLPILNFMDSMESELGVEPQRLLAAMVGLKDSELTQSPEESKESFLRNLQVPEYQIQKADAMYSKMLDQVGQIEMNQSLAPKNQDLSMEVLSPEDFHLRQRDEGIDRMNKSFFVGERQFAVRDPMASGAKPLEQAQALSNKEFFPGMEQQASQKEGAIPLKGLENQAFKTESMSSEQLPFQSSGFRGNQQEAYSTNPEMKAADFAQRMNSNLPNEANLSSLSPEQGGKGFGGQGFNQQMGSSQDFEGMSQAMNGSSGSEAEVTTKSVEDFSSRITAIQSKMDKGNDEVETEKMDFTRSNQAESKVDQAKTFRVDSRLMTQTPDKAVETANANEVIDRAQLFIRRGGGEMKIQLQPEGLGQVNLKVNVHKGDVNVQMVTETAEAKQILERGLGDLRANLGQQKLNVEMVKVDVSNQTGNQDSGKFDFSDSREQARDFMNSFRDAQDDFRQGFLGTPGIKAYGGVDSRAKQLDPEDLDQPRRPKESTRRLDLVA